MREILVATSAYARPLARPPVRPSVRPSVGLWGSGREVPRQPDGGWRMPSFLGGKSRRTFGGLLAGGLRVFLSQQNPGKREWIRDHRRHLRSWENRSGASDKARGRVWEKEKNRLLENPSPVSRRFLLRPPADKTFWLVDLLSIIVSLESSREEAD